MPVAIRGGMPTIAMWSTRAFRCILIVQEARIEVQLLEGDRLVRTQSAESAEHALAIAEMWRAETPRDSSPKPAPAWAVPAPAPEPPAPPPPTRPRAVRPLRRSTFAVPRSIDIERC
jgi:hypothetical protein